VDPDALQLPDAVVMADAFHVPEAAAGNRPDESFTGSLTTRVPVISPEKAMGLSSFPSSDGGDLSVPLTVAAILPSAETLPERLALMESPPHDPETEPERAPPLRENLRVPDPSPENLP